MRFDITQAQELQKYISKIDNHVNKNHKQKWVKYIKLASKTVRLIGYADEYLTHIERQLSYIVSDHEVSFDTTVILWHETDIKSLSDNLLSEVNPHKLRLTKLMTRKSDLDITVFDENYSVSRPIMSVNYSEGVVVDGYNPETNTHYYGAEDLSPEEFIKKGHVFVQIFNKIAKTATSALVHGASVGLDGEGVLFCARGQRGKSTLSVLSMMKGFDYVSDDYLILEKENDSLYSYPIYSIITLSPRMYNELYDELEGSRFLSNNARKDKYVINIANYHEQFKEKYPVKFCMFPEIVDDAEPSIVPCPKGRSVVQLVQSTVGQLQDINDQDTIKKIMDMVDGYEFYQINLSQDIHKNTECLREFMKNYDTREQATFIEDKMYVDVTFNLAYILDSEKGTIYSMNELATNVYENLVAGVSKDEILSELMAVENMPETMVDNFNSFVEAMLDKKIIKDLKSNGQQVNIKREFIEMCNYSLSLVEHSPKMNKNLIIDYKKEK